MQTLGLLHGAQAASQLKKWEQSIDMLNTLIEKFEKSPYLSEAFYERGWAQQKKGNLDEAWADFEKAAEDTHALGARARFMMGELRFGQKQYDDAIREFKRTMYLYGGDDAPEDVKVWQAKAAFDAGRCTEVQIEAASSAQVRAAAIAEAKKFYSFIIQKHPQNGLATEAKKRLEALAKL
jgi:tetratricopeptide (TPR) repeat protein